MSIKLTDTQLVLLGAAAQRKDLCLVAPPTLKGATAQKVASKLISAGFIKEVKAKASDPIWRRDEESGASYALKLTAAGAKAIAVDDAAEPEDASEKSDALANHDQAAILSKLDAKEARPAEAMEPSPAGPSAPRGGSKLARVIGLLERDHGATIEELIAATGWLAHTTRAALTGLRKRAYAVAIDRSNDKRGSFYRIPAGEIGLFEGPANSKTARRKEFGGLDKETLRVLRQPTGHRPASSDLHPFEARIATTREGTKLQAGTLLAREWNGRLERVIILDQGVAWNGKTYGSLSQVAKAITGTSWNGHRFFGLRTAKSDRSGMVPRRSGDCDVASPDAASTPIGDGGAAFARKPGRQAAPP
jgi:hypothetical protein